MTGLDSFVFGLFRTIRDSLFKYMYSKEEYQRELVEGVLGRPMYGAPIEVLTLQRAFVPGKENDLCLSVGNEVLMFFEAQSIPSVNICLRYLIYLSNTIERMISADDPLRLYGSEIITMPRIKLYVVYTGDAEIDPFYTSDIHFGAFSDIHLKVTCLTRREKTGSEFLDQYIKVCIKITELRKAGFKGEDLVNALYHYCRENNLLWDLFLKNKEEVMNVLSEEERIAIINEQCQRHIEAENTKKILSNLSKKLGIPAEELRALAADEDSGFHSTPGRMQAPKMTF